MRRIIKDEAPEFWMKFVKKHPHIRYNELSNHNEGKKLRADIKSHMIKQQQHLCGYCCRQIDITCSHNEHIKPQKKYTHLSMNYNNLIASCTSDTCGMRKSHEYEEDKFISPLQPDCESHFYFEPDGRVIGITEAGKYTVQLLNLNSYALTDARSNLYDECLKMAEYCGKEYIMDQYIKPKDGYLHRFVDMIQYFYKRGDFDEL